MSKKGEGAGEGGRRHEVDLMGSASKAKIRVLYKMHEL